MGTLHLPSEDKTHIPERSQRSRSVVPTIHYYRGMLGRIPFPLSLQPQEGRNHSTHSLSLSLGKETPSLCPPSIQKKKEKQRERGNHFINTACAWNVQVLKLEFDGSNKTRNTSRLPKNHLPLLPTTSNTLLSVVNILERHFIVREICAARLLRPLMCLRRAFEGLSPPPHPPAPTLVPRLRHRHTVLGHRSRSRLRVRYGCNKGGGAAEKMR